MRRRSVSLGFVSLRTNVFVIGRIAVKGFKCRNQINDGVAVD